MSFPIPDTVVPARVRDLAEGAALTPVWLNNIGGLTFRTDDGRYIKWGPHDLEANMRDEAERITIALEGRSAADPRWHRDPERAVRAVGEGLRMLHDALPVDECPWEWSVESRIAGAAERGTIVPVELRDAPPVDRLVVCHGDAWLPNTLLTDDGVAAGHVDLAALGVADRWADIAVASMSTEWNLGDGWQDVLIDAYGIAPDRKRLDYYRRLWNET